VHFHHVVQRERLFRTPPEVIVVHLGGNDLLTSSLYKLRRVINKEIKKYLNECFPDAKVIWYDILQRRNWRGDHKVNLSIEKKRRRVNAFCRKAVVGQSLSRTLSADIDYKTKRFYREEGIHLSDIGFEMFLDTLRDGIVKCLGLEFGG
jgi:hypothetical protein